MRNIVGIGDDEVIWPYIEYQMITVNISFKCCSGARTSPEPQFSLTWLFHSLCRYSVYDVDRVSILNTCCFPKF